MIISETTALPPLANHSPSKPQVHRLMQISGLDIDLDISAEIDIRQLDATAILNCIITSLVRYQSLPNRWL